MTSVPLSASTRVDGPLATPMPTIFLDGSVIANWSESFGTLSSERGEIRYGMSRALEELYVLTASDWELRSDYETCGFTSSTPPPTYAEFTSLPTVPITLDLSQHGVLDGILFTYQICPETRTFEEIVASCIWPNFHSVYGSSALSAFRQIAFARIKLSRLSLFLERARGRLKLLAWLIRIKIRLAGVPRFFRHVVIAERNWFLYHGNHPPKLLNGLATGLRGFSGGCAPRPLLA
jgi:hypothetical protein